MKIIKFFLLMLCAALTGLAQNQTTKWHFGQYSGLDFMTTPPTVITSSILTLEGCSSIADAAGNTLFYTDGITVYNQQNLVMANGTGLGGGASTTQSALIVKQPGNNNIYYVFTIGDSGDSLCYSIVDMVLAAGLGSVTVKNTYLHSPSTEKLTAVKHCNGTDLWVISHDYNNNNFRCYQLTSSGVNSVPVISAIGTVHTGTWSYVGYLKASPNGKKLGLGVYGVNYFEVYDFDPSTGLVSNPLILGNLLYPYGCEFSSDGTKFYGTREGQVSIYQWDLCAGSNTAIVASRYTIATMAGVGLYGMQMAPNGKMYVSRQGQFLGAINNPNATGAGCNFVDLAQSIAPANCLSGLPNFVSSYFNPPPGPFLSATLACQATVSFSASAAAATFNNCSASINSGVNLSWNFGDPNSGAANTSSLSNPSHLYSSPGTYTTQLIRTYQCSADTFIQAVTVPASQAPSFSLSGEFIICENEGTVLTATGATGQAMLNYTWNPTGSPNFSIAVSPTATTVYTVTGKDLNGCLTTHTVEVIVNPCTGFSGQKAIAKAKIYPNPNDGNFIIETSLQNFSYKICNRLGVTVDSGFSEAGNKPIDLKNVPNGIYLLELNGEGRILRFKLMKSN
ncbi:MAG: T9SS type A sorting domain-containing protein [Bacteroidota bacterium]